MLPRLFMALHFSLFLSAERSSNQEISTAGIGKVCVASSSRKRIWVDAEYSFGEGSTFRFSSASCAKGVVAVNECLSSLWSTSCPLFEGSSGCVFCVKTCYRLPLITK